MATWQPTKTRSGERGSCRSIIMTGLERIAGRSREALKTRREAVEWEQHFLMKEGSGFKYDVF